MIIREMTEAALLERRENCDEEEKQFYKEVGELSGQQQKNPGEAPSGGTSGAGGLFCKDQPDCRT